MGNYKFEYLWLDGYKPVANLRAKTKVIALENYNGDLDLIPEWNFDGSSTRQATGDNSEVVLKPVRIYPDPDRENGYIVVSECLNPDGTPHADNTRRLIDDEAIKDFWFGFEQEYILMNDSGRPLGFPSGGYPEPQGPYYCAVGYQNVAGREIIEEHMEACLSAGLGITGVNAEVMLGQWEYQCFGEGIKACDDLIVSRYLLYRVTEKYKVQATLHPKPIQGDWNGSGLHTNFSYPYLRDVGGQEYIEKLLDLYGEYHEEHIANYGAYNELRLTGAHETASIKEFSYGVSNRGCSIRIPIFTVNDNWKGYLEDRRPASNADPYKVVHHIVKAIDTIHNKIT
jgi:glutamine synthetase